MKATRSILLVGATLAIARVPDAAPDPAPPGKIIGQVQFFKNGKETTPPTDGFVYLRSKRDLKTNPLKSVKAAIHQYKETFVPTRLVVPTGSTVAFPNDDAKEHNVFSPSPPMFNLLRYKGGQSKDRVFATAGEYDIYCDIHVSMKAKVKVVDSDLIASVVNGAYTFRDVPPGTYEVVAWAPDSEEVTEPTPIKVVAGQTVTLADALHLQLGSGKPHNHANGKPYSPKDVY